MAFCLNPSTHPTIARARAGHFDSFPLNIKLAEVGLLSAPAAVGSFVGGPDPEDGIAHAGVGLGAHAGVGLRSQAGAGLGAQAVAGLEAQTVADATG
jgi:hypothetical protein